MGFLSRFWGQRILGRFPIDDLVWERSLALPLFRGFSADDTDRLRTLSTLFLHRKRFYGAHGFVIDDDMRVRIASQACLPILRLDLDWLRAWTTVIVYPGEFIAPHEEVDDAGVVHSFQDVLSGETSDVGGVALSWEDVCHSGRGHGYNVVIHEIAHKIDMLSGAADGFPPLHKDMSATAWNAAFAPAFEHLIRLSDARVVSEIDTYAAEDPAECFAVLSEAFFEEPRTLTRHYPDVYRQLCLFYRQDPKERAPP